MILITGGFGYFGSHACCCLAEVVMDFLVLDNLSNSSIESLKRVHRITGKEV